MSKCSEFWNANLFVGGIGKTNFNGKENEITLQLGRKQNNEYKKELAKAEKERRLTLLVAPEKWEEFKTLGKSCQNEAASQVSIPIVAGAATGAATLGIAGGGLGIYFLPKFIKCFV